MNGIGVDGRRPKKKDQLSPGFAMDLTGFVA
jgi:hypothetical protein